MSLQNLLINRKRNVRECIEDESIVFLDRTSDVKNKFAKAFFSETICGVIGDAYDYYAGLNRPHNIFYKNAGLLDHDAGKKIFKLTSMYNTIRFLHARRLDPRQLVGALFYIFLYTEDDEEVFFNFIDMALVSRPAFEMEFTRYAADILFDTPDKSPFSLVFVSSFFYNAYMELITCQSVSQMSSKRPLTRETVIF